MDIIFSVVAKILEYTVAPLGRQLGYLLSYTTNVQNLTRQKEELTSARVRLQHRINDATDSCEEIYDDVLRWRSMVDEITERFDSFLNEEGHAKAKCSSCGSVLHLVTRHQLSRNAKKMSADICELLKRSTFELISYPRQIESSFATIAKDYENFDSRKAILEDIMAAMRDPSRNKIGFCGMGGIGKTMLAKEIARKVEEENLFSKVIMTTISQKPNIKDIQEEIANMLQLKFDQSDGMRKRADLLRMRLKQDESKILLILDDVWEKLDLEDIGIHDECKMLLTSRSEDVCHKYTGVVENNIFKIKPLDLREAVGLFKRIAGEIIEKPDYKDLAHKIVGECGGLPISITTVAHALKSHMHLYTWKDALGKLQSSTLTGIDEMDEKVYSSIKLSYDFLRGDEEAKSLLLLCALHKEDAQIKVEDLMKYSMGCSFLQNIDTVSQARDRVKSLVDKLKSHCLLLDGWRKGLVKMHDVVRDVCISIAKEDKYKMNNITKATMYDKFVRDETNKESKVISFLSYDDYDEFPQKLECPSLELLFMSSLSSRSIPNDFFRRTRKLEALQMNGKFHILSSSFWYIQNLQILCLRETYLEDIAVIGELKSLKVLDLSRTKSIKLLPKEIGQLCCLQLLDLRGCYCLEVIEPDVISNLTHMEELYLPAEFQEWDIEDGIKKERRNARLEEIKSLHRLTTLHLSIPSKHVLPKGLFAEKLETYRIFIGDKYSHDIFFDELETSRSLHLTLNKNEINAFGLDSLIKRSEYLSLEGLKDVSNVVHDLDEDGFPTLKNLRLQCLPFLERICQGNLPAHSLSELRMVEVSNCGRLNNLFPLSVVKLLHGIKVEECNIMEGIVSGHERENEGDDEAVDNIIEFLELRSLVLESLPNLFHFYCTKQKTIEEPSLVDHSKPFFNNTVSLPNLTQLRLRSCNRIEYVFCFGMAERLVNLKELEVVDCEAMKCILKGSKTGEERRLPENTTFFPKLETLKLHKLPALKAFCSEQVSVGEDEGKITPIPKYAFNGTILFSSLKKLTVQTCDNLKYLLSFAMATRLVQLEELEISRCKNIEEVIANDEESGESISIIFDKLQTLQLYDLPNLVKFWEGDCIKCPLLSKLVIMRCPKALKFISNSSMGKKQCPVSEEMGMVAASKQSFFKDKVNFPNLQTLKTDWNGVVMEMFEMSSQSSSTISTFSNLFELDVTYSSPDKSIALSDVELFLHKNHNIHILRLRGSFVDGFRQLQPADSELINTTTSTSLMYLDISDAHGLNHMFEGPSHSILFRNLKSLSIEFCSRLQKIPPLFMAFHKLETLKIHGCERLTYLLDTSTAARLPQLKEMDISWCKGMKVVISDDEQRQPEPLAQFVFDTLHTLTLNDLPNLKSFYSGDKVMSFPNLNNIKVDGKNVEIKDGDVNKTIRKLWEDKCHLFTQQKDADADCADEVSSIVRTRSERHLRTCESSRGNHKNLKKNEIKYISWKTFP